MLKSWEIFYVDTSEEVTNLGYLPGGVNCTRTMWSSYCTAALRSIILGSGQSWCLYILSSSFWPSLRMSWCGGGGAASAGQHSMSLSVWITARPLLAASPAPHTLYSLHIFRWCKNWTGRGFYEIWRYGHFPGNQAAVPGSQSAGCRGPAWEIELALSSSLYLGYWNRISANRKLFYSCLLLVSECGLLGSWPSRHPSPVSLTRWPAQCPPPHRRVRCQPRLCSLKILILITCKMVKMAPSCAAPSTAIG